MSDLDWSSGELAEGLRCYRAGEFFAAHEHWEAVWLRAGEPEKTLLQAVIQVAAAFHHFQRNNLMGTASLLNGARWRLEQFPDAFGGINLAGLRTGIKVWLDMLGNGESTEGLAVPEIAVTAGEADKTR